MMSAYKKTLVLLFVIVGLSVLIGCAKSDTENAAETGSGVVEAASTVLPGDPEDFDSGETLALGQALGLYELPANAITIPAETIENARIEAEAADRLSGKETKRLLIGANIALPAQIASDWERIEDGRGGVAYRLTIHAEDADHIRPHFIGDLNDKDIEVVVYGSDPERLAISARSASTENDVEFWGPTVGGSVLFVEVESAARPRIGVDIVSVGFPSEQEKLGTCYKDPTCYSDWNAIKSGATYITFVDGAYQYLCSASLLNDTTSSGRPWLLTANHCIGTQTVASTIEVVWKYHTSVCNGALPNFSSLPRTYGSTLKCAGSTSDYSLMLLNSNPPAGTVYEGWTTANLAVNAAITAIHHPGGSWKRITFGKVTKTSGNFWTVKYSLSSTEGGSSGSPLFNSSKQVVGQLYGGTASCKKMNNTDIWGKFGVSYNACLKNFLAQ